MHRPRLATRLARAALLALLGLSVAVPAQAQVPRTQLLSQAAGGGFPNGPSRNGAFSQDRQLARLAAFESDASNIVEGDGNGLTDVFLVRRTGRINRNGPPWRIGRTSLISRGMDGGPGNGRSYRPDIDGEQNYRPRCVAFVSEASNLVPGDTNGKADAFVYFVRNRRIERVSLSSSGEQANGDTFEVKVDGHCDRVAFVSDATNLALTGTDRVSWRSAVTGGPPEGTRQVYVRIIGGRRDNYRLDGMTFLASASQSGEPGNGNSRQVAWGRSGGGCGRQGRCGDFSGEDVFFSSSADNLVQGDTNGESDIFQRNFIRRVVRIRFPRPRVVDGERLQTLQLGVGPLRMRVRRVSVTRDGEEANGPSFKPAANDPGRFVVFQTEASNLLPGDTNRVADIARADTSDGSIGWVSRKGSDGPIGDGPSDNPVIGRTGLDIVFDSEATNLEQNDKNCTGDIFHLDIPANNQIFTSLDSLNRIPNAPFGTTAECPPVIAAPARNPAVSYYLNYALFESSWPLFDIPLANRVFPGLENDLARAAQMSLDQPNLHQVYLRYISPR